MQSQTPKRLRVSAHCPNRARHAHNDKRPSLSVKVFDDGGVAPKCFGSCTRKEILQALSLEERDLHVNGHARKLDLPPVKGKA